MQKNIANTLKNVNDESPLAPLKNDREVSCSILHLGRIVIYYVCNSSLCLHEKELLTMFKPLDRPRDVQPMESVDAKVLETFEYEYPGSDCELHLETDEFTAVCPWSGLPDFGTIKIDYIPDKLCIELRSLKYYLLLYRDVGIYQEHVVNRILKDLVGCCHPKRMKVTADYKIRGGIHTVANVEYKKS